MQNDGVEGLAEAYGGFLQNNFDTLVLEKQNPTILATNAHITMDNQEFYQVFKEVLARKMTRKNLSV